MILFKEDLVVNEMQHQILTVRHDMIYLQMSHVEQIITQILSLNKYILSLKREHFFIITLTLTTLQRLNNQDDVY